MLIKKLDIPIIDTFRDSFPHLMRTPPLNHVQRRPAVLRLRSGARTHEEGVFQLTL